MVDIGEQVVTFLSITGSDNPQIAQQYLEMSNGNLENAISLFMDQGGLAGPGGSGEAPDFIPPSAYADGSEDEVRAPMKAFDDQLVQGIGRGSAIQEKQRKQAIERDHEKSRNRMAFALEPEENNQKKGGAKKRRISSPYLSKKFETNSVAVAPQSHFLAS